MIDTFNFYGDIPKDFYFSVELHRIIDSESITTKFTQSITYNSDEQLSPFSDDYAINIRCSDFSVNIKYIIVCMLVPLQSKIKSIRLGIPYGNHLYEYMYVPFIKKDNIYIIPLINREINGLLIKGCKNIRIIISIENYDGHVFAKIQTIGTHFFHHMFPQVCDKL